MVRAIINHMLPVADQYIITQVTATALNKVYDVYVIDKPCGEKLVLKHDPSGYEGRVYQEVLTGNLPWPNAMTYIPISRAHGCSWHTWVKQPLPKAA
jgi:hypothetical protein